MASMAENSIATGLTSLAFLILERSERFSRIDSRHHLGPSPLRMRALSEENLYTGKDPLSVSPRSLVNEVRRNESTGGTDVSAMRATPREMDASV